MRVLVCTPDHTSSQWFLELLYAMVHLSDDVCVIQLVSSGSAEVNSRRGVVMALQLRRDLGRVLKCPTLLLVTSYLCSAHLVPMLHREVFSLMLLDDGSRVMEPEGRGPSDHGGAIHQGGDGGRPCSGEVGVASDGVMVGQRWCGF